MNNVSENLNDYFIKYKGEGCSFVTASIPKNEVKLSVFGKIKNIIKGWII
jgi:hypothetical protein